MITRRTATFYFVASAAVLTPAQAADPFWKSKKPSEWSPEEIDQLMTNSPWAKEVKAEIDRQDMKERMGGRGRGGMGGGMGIPGMGGGRGGRGSGGRPEFKALVRWESALPVREASKKETDLNVAENYIISLSGLPMPGAGRGREGGERRQPTEDMLKELKQVTQLQCNRKVALHPANVQDVDERMLFFFRREEPIDSDDKEAVFVTKLGPLDVKAKFPLKDMKYEGKLEL